LDDALHLYPPSIYQKARPVDHQYEKDGLRIMGSVYRPYKPRVPEYLDYNVLDYVKSIDDDNYNDYAVVPRNTVLSREALKRYTNKVVMQPEDLNVWLNAAQSLEKEFSCCGPSVIFDYDYVLSQLDSKKSPGYPWTLEHMYKYDYWNSEQCAFYNNYLDSLATDDPIPVFCSVQVKEEIRLKSKLAQNKARTVVSVDVNHLVAHCTYVLDQNERLIKNCLNGCSSALGINLLQGGTQKLYYYQCPWGDIPCILSIDADKFDGRYHKVAFDVVYDMRFKLLDGQYRTPFHYKRLKNLCKQIYSSALVDIDGIVYFRDDETAGNCSGQGATTPDNIMKNFVDVLAMYYLAVPIAFRTYLSFKYYTRLALVGDDIMLSVHPDIQCYFNQESIIRDSAKIGMSYTFERQGFTRFIDSTFVGHTFLRTRIPDTDFYMYLPNIDCNKMRSSMLIFNTEKIYPIQSALVRCCGIRNETFACESCRKWFSDLYLYLLTLVDQSAKYVVEIKKNYLTDTQLWILYTGITFADLYIYKNRPVANKILTPQ